MNKILQTLFVFLLLFLNAYGGGDCNQLPKQYSSYEEAIQKIKTTHFKVEENINTSKSSWVRGASYYSCDGISGFFILKTDNKEYIHSMVPIGVWNEFKNAGSFGSYYNQNIKHKYFFKPN